MGSYIIHVMLLMERESVCTTDRSAASEKVKITVASVTGVRTQTATSEKELTPLHRLTPIYTER